MAMASNREYFTVKAVATYEARPISIRAGLTPAEASAVHTVFCEWGDNNGKKNDCFKITSLKLYKNARSNW